MNVNIRKKFFKLRNEYIELKNQTFSDEIDLEESLRLQDKKDKIYKKCRFYKGFIEASEKIKEV